MNKPFKLILITIISLFVILTITIHILSSDLCVAKQAINGKTQCVLQMSKIRYLWSYLFDRENLQSSINMNYADKMASRSGKLIKSNSKEQCLNLKLYRIYDEKIYLADVNPSLIKYYRTSEKSKFDGFNEGDNLKICDLLINDITPPEKYMYGVKDYFVLITKELSNIDTVIIAADDDVFTGKWKSGSESYNLSLYLNQKGDLLEGDYCAYTDTLSKLDCDMLDRGKKSISAKVKGNSANLTFTDWRSSKTGIAKIIYKDGKLQWTLINEPGKLLEDYILPSYAILTRE